MSGAVELLPCPFCGGPAQTPFENDGGLCTSCASEIEICAGFDILTPVSFWNTRAPDPRIAVLEAEVVRLRALLARTIPAGKVIGEFYDPPVPENEIVLECWLTWGTLRDIRAALNPAPSPQPPARRRRGDGDL